MKRIITFSLLLAGNHYVNASEVHPESDAKAGEGFGGLSGMMVGAAAGGPVGAVAGAMAGIFTGGSVQDGANIYQREDGTWSWINDQGTAGVSRKKLTDEHSDKNTDHGSSYSLH
ncbi:hypothetical protein [Azomonas macrocytogenes]|uniref:Outer membrane lipoprotein SlyB n=1 Tax=Azomonas macrocytogenes TaxID=69962 RepID=A0A839T1D9_AZOMA|nr:hypothetical protein [Azomonas macrocytogenes]MBB3102214.1 outer membrane lipoprotein SlyB [Azomonas macrocytogenes]